MKLLTSRKLRLPSYITCVRFIDCHPHFSTSFSLAHTHALSPTVQIEGLFRFSHTKGFGSSFRYHSACPSTTPLTTVVSQYHEAIELLGARSADIHPRSARTVFSTPMRFSHILRWRWMHSRITWSGECINCFGDITNKRTCMHKHVQAYMCKCKCNMYS